MSQGFNPRRHRPSRIEEGRWAMFAHAAGDPIPTDPEILRVLILALQGRVKSMDRTIDKRHSYLRYPFQTIQARFSMRRRICWIEYNVSIAHSTNNSPNASDFMSG